MSARIAPQPTQNLATQKRRQAFKLQLSASDMWELQKTRDNTKSKLEIIAPYIPIFSWALWLLVGSFYYAYADDFGIVFGFYQSVNIGWSLGWATPIETSHYLSVGSMVFSTVHTSIGVMFIGIAVIYIAKQATESKDTWMMEVVKQDKLIDAANTEGYWDDIVAAVETYSSKYKIIFFWLLWLIVGLIFGIVWIDEWDASISMDFVLSCVSGGGYLSLPPGSSKWKYLFIAFYTAVGMPITSISIGLIISFAIISNDSAAYYDAICSVITDKELEFMKIFGIDDGDGTIDNREFIILIAVRFGAASPMLLGQIKERFQELDRDRTGYIKYDDLIAGRRGKKISKKFQNVLNNNSFKIAALLGQKKEQTSSFMDAKRNMYGVSESFNEKDEVPDSSDSESEQAQESKIACVGDNEIVSGSDSKQGGGNQIDAGDHVEAKEEQKDEGEAKVRQFRAHFLDDDIESNMAALQTKIIYQSNKKGDESKNKNKNAVDVASSNNSSSSESEIRKQQTKSSTTACIDNDQASFFKVAKAAQMWKKSSEANLAAQSLTTTTAVASAPLSNAEKREESLPNRRQTYISQRSNSLLVVQREKEKKTSKIFFSALLLTLRNPMFQSLLAWIGWLLVGTIFYMVHEDRNIGEALYYSISVGYGIFWLSVDANVTSAIFTRVHFCLGMVAIGLMMAAFASVLVDSKTKWYVEAMKIKALEEAGDTEGYWDDILAFFTVYGPRLKIHLIFLLCVFIGVLWSCLAIKWPMIEAFYFAVSSLTTGGLWPIPEHSPAWHYAFTAFYVVWGVPVMAISLGMIANSVSNVGGSRQLEQKISARITDEEIDMMESFGIVDDDGSIDAKEFAILTLVRIGALQPSLICMIHERFEAIDVNKTGSITYDDLKNYTSAKMSTYGKNMNNKNKHANRKLGFS